jgi:hypothetical protein
VSPQEVVLPLAVLMWGDAALPGFREVVNAYPAWWFEAANVPAPSRTVIPSRPSRRPQPEPPLLDLLGAADAQTTLPWLERFFASPLLVAQKALSSGRGLPSDDEVRRLLLVVTERGGRMTRVTLAQRMGIPLFRLTPLLAATRRLLNVDGLQVLDVEEASDTVVLNRRLLEQQFEIDIR